MQIKLFTDSLTTRYNTLVGNIKAKSNSFYDSFLDLQEATIKYFLDQNSIFYDSTRTCGFIIKEDNVKNFLKSVLKVDNYTYEKIIDYTKKVNDHKHKKEKLLSVESVINYLAVYFNLVNCYLDFIKGIRIEYDANYYSSIFGETERLNSQYRTELTKLKEEISELYETNKISAHDIESFKLLIADKDLELLNLDEQNKQLQSQINILKDIKLNSLEEKLNKTLDMLNDMQDYLAENRILGKRTSKLIDGYEITDEELKAERIKMMGDKNAR